jgi:hypothetical protein
MLRTIDIRGTKTTEHEHEHEHEHDGVRINTSIGAARGTSI